MNRVERYRNRREAGEALVGGLAEYRGGNVLILAVPRGGVPVALPVVLELECGLDLIIPRKIGAPYQPELAIGAVCEDGQVLLNDRLVRGLNINEDYIKEAAAREVEEISRRLTAYRGGRRPEDATGKTVIVIDDGVATGFTITAALQSASRRNPAQLILAVPVGARDTIKKLTKEVDRVVCPLQPENFYAVGQFYKEFSQLKDEEIREMLQRAWQE